MFSEIAITVSRQLYVRDTDTTLNILLVVQLINYDDGPEIVQMCHYIKGIVQK